MFSQIIFRSNEIIILIFFIIFSSIGYVYE